VKMAHQRAYDNGGMTMFGIRITEQARGQKKMYTKTAMKNKKSRRTLNSHIT
jgi:hypothetical protein